MLYVAIVSSVQYHIVMPVIPSHARKNSNPPPIGRHNNSTAVGSLASVVQEKTRGRDTAVGVAPARARYTVYNIMYEYIIILYDII